MTSVGVWQPEEVPLTASTLARLSDASDFIDDATLGLTANEVAKWSGVMKLDAQIWTPLLAAESDARLIRLVRFFTLAEMRLPGWEAGARSPVIRIVAELKRRDAYPNELTAWIKANTTNRFLPYGSLAERL
jgi:hypothetical protein